MTSPPTSAPPLTTESAYEAVATIRRFEERALELSRDGLIAGSIHLCTGQEAVPVGAMAALEARDRILTTYRGHGWAMASGVPLDSLLAELCHRGEGLNGGRGGSAHLFAPQWGLLGENSIVGAGVPIGSGVAMAAQTLDTGAVTLVSIGDGAMNQGSVHEALAFAAARDLPLVVVVENNGWAEMTPAASMTRTKTLVERAAGYGITAYSVDGSDPFLVRDVVAEAAAEARTGRGPLLIEAMVPRLGGHYNKDVQHYRPQADQEAAQQRDPLLLLRSTLLASGPGEQAATAIDGRVAKAVDAATDAVRAMAPPDPSSAHDHLYAQTSPTPVAPQDGRRRELTYVHAVREALRADLHADERVMFYGEDVAVAGGIFGQSGGLTRQFGPQRVFDTPIAESAILGSAVGAAMSGLRPVVEIMWADFLLVALDQLVNQAANVRYVSRGEVTAPLVVRTQQGVTPGSCAQHSQSLEALLTHVPGLRVGMPSTPQDAYSMLRAAVASDDPVVVIESRSLYSRKGAVHTGRVEPVGGAAVRREGGDVALIGWGAVMPQVLAAADQLAQGGIESTVVDLRWLNPLDTTRLEQAVRDCGGRVLIVHEANLSGGFGAEIAARIQETMFEELQRPVVRLGAADSRIPAAPALQGALLPSTDKIVKAATQLTTAHAVGHTEGAGS